MVKHGNIPEKVFDTSTIRLNSEFSWNIFYHSDLSVAMFLSMADKFVCGNCAGTIALLVSF
jgi:hypothetical protein